MLVIVVGNVMGVFILDGVLNLFCVEYNNERLVMEFYDHWDNNYLKVDYVHDKKRGYSNIIMDIVASC